MDLLETIKLSLEGIRTNKLRSFLTMLGIIIGISSVITITTIGNGMQKSVNSAFDTFGSNSVYMMIEPREGYSWDDMTTDNFVNLDMVDDLEERFPDIIDGVSLEMNTEQGKIRDGQRVSEIRYSPSFPISKELDKVEMLAGRFLNKNDIKRRSNVAVISDKVCKEIFNGDINKALGSEIKIDKSNGLSVLTVIGVYKYEKKDFGPLFGDMSGGDKTIVYLPLTVEYSDPQTNYATMAFKNIETINEDMKTVEEYINQKYYSNSKSSQMTLQSMKSQVDQAMNVMNTMQLAVGAIAAISLMVGGIGVMNILLVSVTERTREIGIRKALGATKNDIRKQFIIESVIICIIGGFFGILFGGSLGYFGSIMLKMKSFPSLFSIIIAVGFSMLIGIFFGYYPANKAAKLDPIEALRYE